MSIIDDEPLLKSVSLEKYSQAASLHELQIVDERLADEGPTSSLTLLLRIDPTRYCDFIRMADQSFQISSILHDSFACDQSPLSMVKSAWRDAVGRDSAWSGVLQYAGIHGCGLRGPTSAIRRFLDSKIVRSERSCVAALISNAPLSIPERLVEFGSLSKFDREKFDRFESLARLFRDLRSHSHSEDQIQSLLEAPEAIAALNWFTRTGQKIARYLSPGYKSSLRKERIVAALARGGNYIDGIGIGNLTRFGDHAVCGRKVCIIDSGADESSHWLQRQIVDYVRIDGNGQEKKAHDCVDAACHGTKMSTLICGRPLPLRELGMTRDLLGVLAAEGFETANLCEDSMLRIGVAPGARLVEVGALGGELLAETSTTSVLSSALNWISENHMLGIDVVNVSVEADPTIVKADVRSNLGLVIELMKQRGMVVVAASGNHGGRSVPIVDNALSVGAANRDGGALKGNGGTPVLLAPGQDMLCGQPRLERLGNWLIDVYSGSSIAAAIASGAIAVVAAECNVSSVSAAKALVATAHNKMINVERAVGYFR
jgi:hypothetical protein